MSNFSLDLSRFANLSEKKMETVVKKVFIELSVDIIKDTPVDSGRARSNWQPAINKFANTNVIDTDKSGRKATREVKATANEFKAGDTITLTNNLGYIEVLEYGEFIPKNSENVVGGYSKKAPTGMVRLNVDRFNLITSKHAKDINRKVR